MMNQHSDTSLTSDPTCDHSHEAARPVTLPDARSLERAARLFRALGDLSRLRLLLLLMRGEVCVGELVTTLGEKFSTVSQRLRVLRTEGLVTHRRDGSHVYYRLADDHVKRLVANALAHVDEPDGSNSQPLNAEDER